MVQDWSSYVKNKVRNYELSDIEFTKVNMLDWLEKRNRSTIQDLKKEVHNSTDLVFAAKQEVAFQDKKEIRYKCYHIYSGSRGKCFILAFNSNIKVITVFPLGRTTISNIGKDLNNPPY